MEIVRMIGIALLSGLGGYAGGLHLGIFLEDYFTDKRDAKPAEGSGTGRLVAGPLMALLGVIVATL
jgi:hypothetical protein